MNIISPIQYDLFNFPDLPSLNKCKSIELENFEPLQLQRGYSENIQALKHLPHNPQIQPKAAFQEDHSEPHGLIALFHEDPLPADHPDFEIFPLVDLKQSFENDRDNIVLDYYDAQAEIKEKLEIMPLNIHNNLIEEQKEVAQENLFDEFGFAFGIEELFAQNPEVKIAEKIVEIAEDDIDFFGAFNLDNAFEEAGQIERPVRERREPARRPPRPQRIPRPQGVPNKVEAKDELEENDIFALFDFECFEQMYIKYLLESPYSNDEIDPFFIRCKICMQKCSDYHMFECKHSFCVTCIRQYSESLIETLKVMPEDLTCPDCNAPILDKEIFRFISFDKYEKMVNLKYKIKGQQLCAQKKAIPCPVPDCPGFAHILPNEKITACSKCKCTLCCECGSSVHPGITCEENAKIGIDDTIETLILSQNWKKCPTCGVPVEKIDGCQFLYCDSNICRGKNNLCYICGRFVIEAQHFSHYKTKGPFGDTCNTLDGIEEDPIDPSLMVPIIGDINAPFRNNDWGGGEEE